MEAHGVPDNAMSDETATRCPHCRQWSDEITTLTDALTFEKDAHREMSAVAAERTAELLRAEAALTEARAELNRSLEASSIAESGRLTLEREVIALCDIIIAYHTRSHARPDIRLCAGDLCRAYTQSILKDAPKE